MNQNSEVRHPFKRLAVLMLAFTLTLAAALPSYAATTKIKSLKIRITDNIQPGMRIGDENIDITIDTSHCYLDYYEVDNFGSRWEGDMIPQITIHLQPDEGYVFSSALRNDFTIIGGTYIKGTGVITSDKEFYFTVELTPMDEKTADITGVNLIDSGYVYWDAPMGAGSYELRVYRNGNLAGTTDIKTEDTIYNLKDYMDKAGSYFVRVRACNAKKPENKSEWVETALVTISSERAKEISEGLAFSRPLKGDWLKSDAGWVYQYEDGSLAAPGWLQIENQWFYFDENSIMATGWIEVDGLEYYMDDITGRLLTNTTTPDGYKVDANGNKRTD